VACARRRAHGPRSLRVSLGDAGKKALRVVTGNQDRSIRRHRDASRGTVLVVERLWRGTPPLGDGDELVVGFIRTRPLRRHNRMLRWEHALRRSECDEEDSADTRDRSQRSHDCSVHVGYMKRVGSLIPSTFRYASEAGLPSHQSILGSPSEGGLARRSKLGVVRSEGGLARRSKLGVVRLRRREGWPSGRWRWS
jgi:hypothetical protein